MGVIQLEELNTRIDKLEKRDIQDLLTLLEIMSNVHFFGGIKKTCCKHAKDGQCNLFCVPQDAKNRLPLATECRIPGCSANHEHCHLELSNVTCTFCPQWNNKVVKSNNSNPKRGTNKRRKK